MHVNHAPNRLQLDAFDGWTLSGLVRAKPHAQPGTLIDRSDAASPAVCGSFNGSAFVCGSRYPTPSAAHNDSVAA